MKILIVVAMLCLFTACLRQRENSGLYVDSANISAQNKLLVRDSINKSNNHAIEDMPIKLPFGSEILNNNIFSRYWEVGDEADDLDKETSDRYGILCKYYRDLIKRKTIPVPRIEALEYVRLNYPYSFVDSITSSIDSIRYRLPDLGPYQCFYSQIAGNCNQGNIPLEEEEQCCTSAGNLILFEPKTRKARVINIFYDAHGGWEGSTRFFYIGNDGRIQIFKSESDDEGVSFEKEFNITIDNDGKINLTKF